MIKALPGQVISMIYSVQNIKECRIKYSFEDQTQQIGPPEPPSLLARVGVQMRAMVQRDIFCILSFAIFHMSHHHERWAGDKNQLERPQTDMGDGKNVVIADVGASRLETQEAYFF